MSLQNYDQWKLQSPDDGFNDEHDTETCEACNHTAPAVEMNQDPEDDGMYWCDEHFNTSECDHCGTKVHETGITGVRAGDEYYHFCQHCHDDLNG